MADQRCVLTPARERRGFRLGAALRGVAIGVGVAAISVVAAALALQPGLNSTVNDFYFYGTQPQRTIDEGGTLHALVESGNCGLCHGDFTGQPPRNYTLPYSRWSYTMMAQAFRDPIFHAQLQIAEIDAPGSGDSCIRCHAPAGWIQGRSIPTDGTALTYEDTSGVSCSTCHRMVDPVERVSSPLAGTAGQFTSTTDRDLLVALGADRPPNFGHGGPIAANSYVIDPEDRRRGPFDLGVLPFHVWLQTSFHTSSAQCASCHDVSNPVYMKQPDGRFAVTPMNQRHPTGNKYDMYPMDRTYSEWLASSFAAGPVELTKPNPNGVPLGFVGRYSWDGATIDPGNGQHIIFNSQTSYSTCQDCHMPVATGPGCNLNPPLRQVPVHNYAGANSWVIRAVNDLYGGDAAMDDPALIDQSVERNKSMLARAADLEAVKQGSDLVTRIFNQTGHKLPTGFAEGRRMWLNVQFFDANDVLVAERGAYDLATAVLTENDTTVYEIKHGISAELSPIVNLPVGPSFHLDLNNEIFSDNRIPPRGFTNAGFEAIQAKPKGVVYEDGQYWADTNYAIPPGAVRAEVRLYHQTTTKPYIEFLRDKATAVSATLPQPFPPPPAPLSVGQIVYDQWVKWGKSEPVLMALSNVNLGACNRADLTGPGGLPAAPDGDLSIEDFVEFLNAFSSEGGCPGVGPCNVADLTGPGGPPALPDGELSIEDFITFLAEFSDGC